MRKFISILLLAALVMNIAGCEGLRKKFTRKKKGPVKIPKVYQVKKYELIPTPELYKKHYSYWVTWQSELIKVLGENRKKDKRCIDEIMSNLNDMRNMLVKEKADQLKLHIDRMYRIRDMIFKDELNTASKSYAMSTLEREDRYIKREFVYKKMRTYLKTSFDEEPVEPSPGE